jgi:hypothetical protein
MMNPDTPDLHEVPGAPGFFADQDGYVWCNGFRRSGAVDTDGTVWIDGTLRAVLVCSAFHGPAPTPDSTVTHLDGVNDNDLPTNLAWS